MQTFLERLLYLIEMKEEGKHTVFAKKAGIPKSTFQFYVKGRTPHLDHLVRICKTYDVNSNWLLTGEGGMFLSDTGSLADGRADDPVRKKLIEMMDDLNEDELSDLRKYLREKAEMRNMKTELEYLKRKVG